MVNLAISCLKTGKQRRITLSVSLSSPVPKPKSNYSKHGERYSLRTPYIVAPTILQPLEDRILLVLGAKSAANAYLLDLS